MQIKNCLSTEIRINIKCLSSDNELCVLTNSANIFRDQKKYFFFSFYKKHWNEKNMQGIANAYIGTKIF